MREIKRSAIIMGFTVILNPFQGSTFPGAQGHMPLDFAVGP